MIKPITYISASIGIILLLINIAGFFLPLRNPKITQVTAGFPQHRAIVTYQEARDILVRSPQSADEYINRVTNTVNQAMLHYWDAEKANTYHIRVPIYENYLIWAGKFIAPSIYKMYEYCDAEKALERGIGLCSQHAIITTEIFRKNGLDAHIVGLNGHVVTTVRADTINDSWHISDADNGVVIPHSLEEIERNPDIALSAYEKAGFPEDHAQLLASLYASKDDNIIYPDGASGYPDCNWKKILIRKISYIAIWIIPLLLLIPGAWQIIRVTATKPTKK